METVSFKKISTYQFVSHRYCIKIMNTKTNFLILFICLFVYFFFSVSCFVLFLPSSHPFEGVLLEHYHLIIVFGISSEQMLLLLSLFVIKFFFFVIKLCVYHLLNLNYIQSLAFYFISVFVSV